MMHEQEQYPIWIGDCVYAALTALVREDVNDLTTVQRETLSFVGRHPDCTTNDVAGTFGIVQTTAATRLGRLLQLGKLTARLEAGPGGKVRRWRAV